MLTKTKKKIVKNQKLKISKIQNSSFVRTTQTKIQKKSLKRFKSDLREELRFEVLAPIGSNVNEKLKTSQKKKKK